MSQKSSVDSVAVLEQVSRDILLMRLERSTTDLEELGVSPQALHVVFTDVAVAAHDLHGSVGDLLGRRRGEEFDTVGIEALAG